MVSSDIKIAIFQIFFSQKMTYIVYIYVIAMRRNLLIDCLKKTKIRKWGKVFQS